MKPFTRIQTSLPKPVKQSLALLVLLSISFSNVAEQVKYQRKSSEENTHFSYQWHDEKIGMQTLTFALKNPTLFNHFRHFKNFQPETVQRETLTAIRKKLSTFDSRELSWQIKNRPQDFEVFFNAKSDAVLQQAQQAIREVQENTLNAFLQENYYIKYKTPAGIEAIKPDHLRIVKDSYSDVADIASAIIQKYPNIRGQKHIEFLLSFIQNIPYSTLESRIESNGAGFSPPLRLLYNNQGDCDSKVALMAAISKKMYPELRVVMIYLPDHALIGFQLPHLKTDDWVEIDGLDYLLAEPTGPAQLPLAKISNRSRQLIDSHQFTYEIL